MKTVRCPQCNLVNWTTLDFCKRCSFDLTTLRVAGEEAAAVGFGAAAQAGNYQPSAQMPPVNHAPQMPSDYQPQQYQQPPPNFQNPQPQGWGSQASAQTNFGRQNYGNNSNYGQPRTNYQRTNQNVSQKLAIFSLVTGIFSFPLLNFTIGAFVIGMLGAIAGVPGMIIGAVLVFGMIPTSLISGIVALVKAKRYPQQFGGKGMAIAGICLGGFAIITIPLVAAIAIPNLLAARRAANEGAAIATVKTIAKAQNTYMPSMQGNCGDLPALFAANLVDSVIAKGEKSGYRFAVNNLPSGGCEIHATPAVTEGIKASGNRSFYAASDEQWTIHHADKDGRMAGKTDPELNTNF